MAPLAEMLAYELECRAEVCKLTWDAWRHSHDTLREASRMLSVDARWIVGAYVTGAGTIQHSYIEVASDQVIRARELLGAVTRAFWSGVEKSSCQRSGAGGQLVLTLAPGPSGRLAVDRGGEYTDVAAASCLEGLMVSEASKIVLPDELLEVEFEFPEWAVLVDL